MAEDTFLTTAFKDKDRVKALGARWDPNQRKWYVPAGTELALFREWLPAGLAQTGDLLPLPLSSGGDVAVVEAKGVKLSQLLAGVAQAVAEAYRSGVWTMVDVVDARAKNGIVYLELAERTPSGEVTAKSAAIIWTSTAARILPEFERATGAKIGPGIKLLLKLKPVFDPRFGLSLQVEAIDPEYTLGDLEARKREIRQRLQREGLYEFNRSLPAPWDFTAVLVVAPEGAAGLGDFQAEATRLQGAGVCNFVYVHSCFQGEGAAASIRSVLLSAVDAWQGECLDAVVIIRGGGAVNDLAWLNDYDLARCICELPVPVFTGIGHERDSTVLDEVAHTRFDTPSKVIHGIETVIRQRTLESRELYKAITTAAQQLAHHCRLTSENAHAQVKESAHQLLATASRQIEADMAGVRIGAMRVVRSSADESRVAFATIEHAARQQVADARQIMPSVIEGIKGAARASLKEAKNESDQSLRTTLERAGVMAHTIREQSDRAMMDVAIEARRSLRDAATTTSALVREVAGQGPEKTLGRGFAMVKDVGGHSITSATGPVVGQHIEVQFRDGAISAVVREKKV